MMTKFEFTVEGTPISQQAKKRRILNQWKAQVRRTARKYWPHNQPPAKDQLRITLTYFYKFEALDVDNMIKPIQDSLIGLVYHDDRQITDVYSRKRKLNTSFRLLNVSPAIARGLASGREFLHILIEDAKMV
ncbi:MAG TPA: RusA family crossover junction endodeoxyribonuclease [candidate division Zixibacteria bacterium]|nr:RusA family crossover junction endodeoxyribonuclease [candidate division Zixibacteria bacterium]HEQ98231.1 RusA family crossover junction endodeoxyribonuclease [candidate division Zixibacteria bacterium]